MPDDDVPRDHRAARDAMIDEHARARGFPAQHDLLPRGDQRQVAAARCACGSVEVDIVRHRVGLGVDERHLDVVALVHDHQRARHRAVEGHGLKRRAVVVDDNRFSSTFSRNSMIFGPRSVACS